MAYGIQEPEQLAQIITQMSFSGLMEVARQLVEMNAEGERDIKTQTGMASTLSDWAEAVVEEARIEAQHASKPKAA